MPWAASAKERKRPRRPWPRRSGARTAHCASLLPKPCGRPIKILLPWRPWPRSSTTSMTLSMRLPSFRTPSMPWMAWAWKRKPPYPPCWRLSTIAGLRSVRGPPGRQRRHALERAVIVVQAVLRLVFLRRRLFGSCGGSINIPRSCPPCSRRSRIRLTASVPRGRWAASGSKRKKPCPFCSNCSLTKTGRRVSTSPRQGSVPNLAKR